MDSLKNFEPVKGFENGRDVLKFGGSSASASSDILDELESSDILGGGIEI